MNVFFVDTDPAVAARSLCDKHVNKMLLEGVQILNTAIHEYARHEDEFAAREAFYGPTHRTHPCVEWAGESRGNFEWLTAHVYHLNDEYMQRYDHDVAHTSWIKLVDNWGRDDYPHLPENPTPARLFPDVGLTEPPLAMGDFEPDHDDPVAAYREYYRVVKQPQDWFGYERGRSPPNWL